MPRQTGVRVLVIQCSGNVQVGSGMGRDQAVPQVKRIVIQAANIGGARPIPPDDIARGQAAQGGHLSGQASRQQEGADRPWGPRFPVSGGRPGSNGQSSALLVWLAADAARDEM